MIKYIKKIAITIACITLFFTNYVSSEESLTVSSNLAFSSGITLGKIHDIHMGIVGGMSSPAIGLLSLDTSNNVMKEGLEGVAHLGEGTSGKVAIDGPPGQTVSIWITQPTTGSCGTGTLWGVPKCKVLESDDTTIAQTETQCSSTDGVTVTMNQARHYLYVGGILSFHYGHTCHTSADATEGIDNATGVHTVHVAQQ